MYKSIDDVSRNVLTAMLYNEKHGIEHSLPLPVTFALENPLARFSCNTNSRKYAATSAAESLYLLSGMNSADFIQEFRETEVSKSTYPDKSTFGQPLRFYGTMPLELLDYNKANALRQKGIGYTDQLALAVEIFKKDKTATALIQFGTIQNPLAVHTAWFYGENGKLEMLVSAGRVECFAELTLKVVSPFAFLHQIISEISGISLGSSRFAIGCLYAKQSKENVIQSGKFPIINMHDFKYPDGGLTLRDLDTLMSIMMEFVGRLDENTLCRANPFEGDARVQMWSDYAEIFRAWKAEKLGYKIKMEQNFFHPQLRFIYKGEAV